MWKHARTKPEILGITNAQHRGFWQDIVLRQALENNCDDTLRSRKAELKKQLFSLVADQTGKLFNTRVVTLVWARRFAAYKRADLILRDLDAFHDLLEDADHPIQIVWAGKPYPEDQFAVDLFNRLVELTHSFPNAAVLTGYEMDVSAIIKRGADIWLNTPRRPKEASGTSGMTASMNGAVNLSTNDGWIPEFAKHGENAFILPEADVTQLEEEQDDHDHFHLLRILKEEVLPCYYDRPDDWLRLMKRSMEDVVPRFDSHRMADEYYQLLYA